MTLSGMLLSLWVVRDIGRTGRDRNCRGDLALEGLQHHLLKLIGLSRTQPLVSAVRELLGLEANTCMKLHLKALARVRFDPAAVNSLVLFIQPRIFQSDHLKTLLFKTRDVVSDALSVAGL